MKKPTNYKEITQDWLSSSASVEDVTSFVINEIEKASADYEAKINSEKNAVAETSQKLEEAKGEISNLKAQYEQLKADFESLSKKDQEREAKDLLNTRLASLDDVYELSDEDRKVIISNIQGMSQEAYAKYEESLKVLLRDKNREVIASQKDEQKQSSASDESSDDSVESLLAKIKANPALEKLVANSMSVEGDDDLKDLREAFSSKNVLK